MVSEYTLATSPAVLPLLVGIPIAATALKRCALWRAPRLHASHAPASPIARAAILEDMADAVLVLDENHVVVDLNPAARALLWGDESMMCLGRVISDILPMSADYVELDTPEGRRSFDLRVTSLVGSRGSQKGYLMSLHGVSLRDGKLDLVLEATGDSSWDWRPQTDELFLSPHLYRSLGYDATGLPRTLEGWRRMVHPDDIPDLDLALERLDAGGGDTIEKDCRLASTLGDWQWVHVRGRVMGRLLDGRPSRVVGVHSDANARCRSEALLNYRALYDELTAIPNRFLLLDRLKLEFARSSRQGVPFAVAFCDLNEFKEVNDTYGHAGGDELLRQVAQRLSVCVRETDTVGRMGGDEFVLVLTGQTGNAHEAQTVAERVIRQMASPFTIDGGDMKASISIGIAMAPAHGSTVESLMRSADVAMYAAKAKGMSRYAFYSPSLESPQSAAVGSRRWSHQQADGCCVDGPDFEAR